MRRALRRSTGASILLCLSVAAATNAYGDTTGDADRDAPSLPVSTSGSLRLDYFRSDYGLDDSINFAGATAQIKLASSRQDRSFKFEARAINPDLGREAATKTAVLEAYAAWQPERGRIRLGKQIVPWGRADGINPTDVLTPYDYVVLLPFEEDQRSGTIALTADRYLTNELSASLFVTPLFEPTKIPLPRDQATFVDRPPSHRLAHTEVGARINKAGGGADWSMSYFHGYDPFPDFAPLDLSGPMPVLAMNYSAIDMLGADFARNLERFGVRAEAAYVRTADASGHDPFVRNPYWYYVAGVDRTFAANLNVNFQFFGRHIQHFTAADETADAATQTIAQLNNILAAQQDRNSYGLTARIADRWFNDSLRMELLAILNLTRRDYYLRPVMMYDAADNLRLSLGAQIYRGAQDTFFGRLEANRGVFAELRYTF